MTTPTKRLACIAGLALCVMAGRPAAALPVGPDDLGLSLLGALPGGNISIDTGTNGDGGSTPVLTYSGGTLNGNVVTQTGGPDIAVFLFAGGSTLASGDMLTLDAGSRVLALLFNGSARIEGTINVSGSDGGTGGANQAGPRDVGVAGGGNGGQGGPFSGEDGGGPGGGLLGSSSANTLGAGPGSGGAFGTDGGSGGAGPTLRAGGTAYGDPLRDLLQGGSGGGGGGGTCCLGQSFNGGAGGGAGGGGLTIGALNLLELVDATILANGGAGGDGFRDGGGGSGGGILLHAYDILIDSASLVQANGAQGGTGSAQGGCGGAGRIEFVTNSSGSLSNNGNVEALGFGSCNPGDLVTTSLADVGSAGSGSGMATIPEPAAMALFVLGLAGVAVARRRRT